MLDSMKETKILVTGGAGFIGSHLVEKLVSLGADVSVLTRKSTNLWRLDSIKDKISMFRVDFSNINELREVLSNINPEIVFHTIADIRVNRDPRLLEDMIKNNFWVTINLIKSLDKKKLKLFVNFGTCEEYGDGNVPFKENHKEIPVSPYSLSKIMGTYLSSYLAKIESFPIIVVRPFLTYGPKQINDQLIPFMIKSMLRGEKINSTRMEQTRDFIYITDVVSALVKIPISGIKKGEIINICSGEEIQIKKVVKRICELTGRSFEKCIGTGAPYRIGEMMNFYGSNDKARKLLNWKPKVSFEKGLKETVEWSKEHFR